MSLTPGTIIGDYRIEAALGEGGMATVYRVRHEILDTIHALKVLHPHFTRHSDIRDRFLEEGRIQARCRHPNILPVTGVLRDAGVAGLLMALLNGEDLRARLDREGALPLAQAIRFIREVLAALSYVHRQGVIHRDLKPGNLFLERTASGERVRVMDFGIAKVLDRNRTATAMQMGSLGYMSPEQILCPRAVGPAADLFSVGVILYELLIGMLPFDGETAFAIQTQIASGQYTDPCELRPEIPPGISAILVCALAVEPEARFLDAEAFSAALEQVQRPPRATVLEPPDPPPAPAVEPPDPQPAVEPPAPPDPAPIPLWAIGLGLGLMGLVGVVVWTLEQPRTPPEVVVPGAPPAYPMARIASGVFTMGSPLSEAGRSPDETMHEVQLTHAFFMGTTEVSQALYMAVMAENPSWFVNADHPVEQVSWLDAIRFANRLSELEGLPTCYAIDGDDISWPEGPDCTGYRLPTEAEWEYAARAGTRTPYWSGAELSDLDRTGWYKGNASRQTHLIARKDANPWGLHDVHGNVYEWCWDRYEEHYPTTPQVDPGGPSSGQRRVYRGGSWRHVAKYARSSHRSRAEPGQRLRRVGMRLVRTEP